MTATLAGCMDAGRAPSPDAGQLPTTVSSSAPSTASQVTSDYSRLLIEPGDISDRTDTFTVRSSPHKPDGMDGIAALFVNQDDTRAVDVTILVLPDDAAANTTLNAAVDSIGTFVAGGDGPQPTEVGTAGTVVSGTSPDGAKAVTVLLFTEGKAVVRIEFGSAPGDPTPAPFVKDVGKKQEIAVRSGLSA